VKLSDGTYLSFWPINYFGIKDASALRSFASRWQDNSSEDRDIEGHKQNRIIKIRKPIDEQKIKDFWEKNKIKDFNIFNNCATMTLRLIEAGGIDGNDPE
jgi:hypothetical protein